ARGGIKRMTEPATAQSTALPDSSPRVVRVSLTADAMPMPRRCSALAIKSVSRVVSGRRRREGEADSAARMEARVGRDVDTGITRGERIMKKGRGVRKRGEDEGSIGY